MSNLKINKTIVDGSDLVAVIPEAIGDVDYFHIYVYSPVNERLIALGKAYKTKAEAYAEAINYV
jgi:hypothetical protein